MEKFTVKKRIVLISNKLRIGKDGKNAFGNYNYFKPDDIMQALNPLLEEYNLILVFNLNNKESYYQAQLIVEDTESDDRQEYIFDIQKATVKGANEAQNSGATLTYAKRYILMNCFNIADNDADFDSDKMTKKSNSKYENKIPDNINTFSSAEPRTENSILTDPQIKRAYSIAKSNNISEEDLKKWVHTKFNKLNVGDLTRKEYDFLCMSLQQKKEA